MGRSGQTYDPKKCRDAWPGWTKRAGEGLHGLPEFFRVGHQIQNAQIYDLGRVGANLRPQNSWDARARRAKTSQKGEGLPEFFRVGHPIQNAQS